MMQMYNVFLKEKEIIITQNTNNCEPDEFDLIINYSGKEALAEVYRQFAHSKSKLQRLIVDSGANFAEACHDFSNLFRVVVAAGGLVRNSENQYLFIKRYGIWDLPKGMKKQGESDEEAALREVTEETGISMLKIEKPLPSTLHIFEPSGGSQVLKETRWFSMLNTAYEVSLPQIEESITEVRWFDTDELPAIIRSTYKSLRVMLKRALDIHG